MTWWQRLLSWLQGVPPAPPKPNPQPPKPQPVPIPEPMVYLFDALNEIRADHALELFQSDARLDNLAMTWAASMAASGILAHGDSAGRIARVYPNRASAENIAFGQRTAEQVVASWLDSPGHRANMLNPVYTSVGCGRVGDYWTADFLG